MNEGIDVSDVLEILQPKPVYISLNEDVGQTDGWIISNMKNWSYFYSADDLTDYWHEFRKVWQSVCNSDLNGQLVFFNEKDALSEFEWIIFTRSDAEDHHASILQENVRLWQQKLESVGVIDNRSLIQSEGYLLNFSPDSIVILAPRSHGCFNALQTLISVLEFVYVNHKNDQIKPFHIFDYPKLCIRAFHLDLKDMMPTFDYIKDFVSFLARYKTNYLCIEYEDKFPYKEYLAPLVHKYAFTSDQLEELKDFCEMHFIEIIPLIQIFGHVEKFIRKEEFRHLQETESGEPFNLHKYDCWSLCPLEKDSEKFAAEMADQIIDVHKESEYIHIGADEVYQLGTCPKCKDYLETHTKSELYIDFINKVAERIIEKGKKPMMWHDYLLKYPDNLDLLNKDIMIVYWIYRSWRKQSDDNEQILSHFEFFHQRGFKTIGAPSISSDFDPLIPNYQSRLENIAGQCFRANQSGSEGLLNTSWVVCGNPLETQKMGVLIGQGMMWSPPSGWNKIDWETVDKSVQTFLYQIPLKEQSSWFFEFCESTERIGRRWPTEKAIELLPNVLESLDTLKSKANANKVTIDSLRFGLKHRLLYVEILQNFQVFLDYADADSELMDFPCDDYLDELSSFFNNTKQQYLDIIAEVDQFFVKEHHQVKENEFDGIFGLADMSYDRYLDMADLSRVGEILGEVQGSIGDLLLEIFRIKSL